MDEEELWKEWPRDPRIMVSNKGNVVSYKRGGAGYPLKVSYSGSGYQKVSTSHESFSYVHKMVAETWIPNPNHHKEVNHIDGDKDDNRVENLEWVTRSQNIRHAYRTGLKKPSGACKPTPIRIVETDEVFESISECARRIGVTVAAISHCLNGRQSTCRGYHFEYLED